MKTAVVLALVLMLAGCAALDSPIESGESTSSGPKGTPGEKSSAGAPSDVKKTGGLKYTLEVGRSQYESGEAVQLRLIAVNDSSKTIVLRFPSSKTHDFIVRDDRGREVWRWASERFFTQAFREQQLEPEEQFSVTGSWEQKTSDGKTVKPGKYEVEAEFMAVDREQMMGPLSIEISN